MSLPADDPEPIVLWVVRHGERADFADPLWRQTAERPDDPPLSPHGILQAHELGHRLLDEGVAHIFTSPFMRAVQTAFCVAEILRLPVRVEQGLCEWLNAEWFPAMPNGVPPARLAEVFPAVVADYASLVAPRHPESWDQMVVRTAAAAKALAERFGTNLLLVGHGATVLGLCEALPREPPPGVSAPMCGLTKLVRAGGEWRVVLNADTGHLSGPRDGLRLA
jgi:broad specificity phosphatase PhoE